MAELRGLLRWELPGAAYGGDVFCALDAARDTALSCTAEPRRREALYELMLALYRCVYDALVETGRDAVEQLSRRNALLSSLAAEDVLTGLYNHRGFHEAAETAILSPSNRNGRAMLVFVDMDNLKMTNDVFGHEEGNRALRLIADALRECFGGDSIIGRVGGDEFNVFMPLRPGDRPETYRARLKSIIAAAAKRAGVEYAITVSVGINEVCCGEQTRLGECLRRADDDMYSDKCHKPVSIISADCR